MRGMLGVIALTAAICGMLVVIAYAASDAYLNFTSQETDLNSTLLLGSLAPDGWTATELPRSNFNEQFLSPCLAVPLIDGVSASGRGALGFAPTGTAAASGVQLQMIQISGANARAVMTSVQRDTENNCQRGLTVGTVAEADVDVLADTNADDGVIVDLSRRQGGALIDYTEAIVRNGDYITRISYRYDPATAIERSDVAALVSAVVSQIENPPTQGELEAAGAIVAPAFIDRAAERLNADSSRGLSLDGRVSPLIGVAAVGGLVILLYVVGAKLSRSRELSPSPAGQTSMIGSRPTLENYGESQRRWIRKSAHSASASNSSAGFDDDDFATEQTLMQPIPEPSPVLDFPQRSIDEKLKILKEARMREPRPELVTSHPVVPAIDWTEEISKPVPIRENQQPAPVEQISRKALLKKLRSQHHD